MLTTDGKRHIKRYLAGYTPFIAQSIAIGLGSKSEVVGDKKLQFEVERADIALTSYDFVGNKLIFKAPLPEEFAGTIYEVALYSSAVNDEAGEFGSKLISTFDTTEDWVDPSNGSAATFIETADYSRLGADSLRHTPSASGTKTDSLSELLLDLSGHSGADLFSFAFHSQNGHAASISFRFLTDASNYYEFSFGSQTSGYKILEVPKSGATAVGSPDWEEITEIQVLTTSSSSGAAQVYYDGIRIEDTDTINEDYVMVSRELLATPFVKQEGKIQEIEFSLVVNV